MPVVFLAPDPARLAQLRERFGLPDAPHATSLGAASRLIEDADPAGVAVLDAAAEWGPALMASVVDRQVPVLVAAETATVPLVSALLHAGADGFVVVPSEPAVIATAIEAARQSRARQVSQREKVAGAHRQLLRFAEDFRDGYRREKERSRELAESLHRLEASYRQTVLSLAAAVEAKDETTGRHIERVADLAIALAAVVDPTIVEEPLPAFGFLLHDLGKIGIPDVVLLKPGPLTDEEFETMKLHAVIGERIVEGIDFLEPVRGVILHHHERWDGAGYPHGLVGEAIPKAARIFAVADAADAMLHDRPYRAAMSLDRAREELRAAAGTQFDPEVVEAFEGLVESKDRSIPAAHKQAEH